MIYNLLEEISMHIIIADKQEKKHNGITVMEMNVCVCGAQVVLPT